MRTMNDKVLTYVYNCWYGVRCHKREDIERIVTETVNEHPDETSYTKLGMIAKRRCQNEL